MSNASRAMVIVASCAALAITGCGTSFDRERQATLYEVQTHDYATAAARINGLYGSHLAGEPKSAGGWTGKDTSINAKQELLWRMERGLVSSLSGDLEASDLQLDAAAKLVDARRTKSIAAETGTFLLNDNVRPFAARGYEAIQVDYYRILSQLTQAERASGLIHGAEATNSTAADDHYQKAGIRARRMTLDELKEESDQADQHRYRDDPFARFLAGMVTYALPPGSRGEDDEQFTQVMFKRSLDAYVVEQHALDHDRNFRWEVGHRPRLVERMFLRHCLSYDPGSYADSAKHFGLNPEPRPILPAGYGSLLVLNHVGFISRPQVLSIGFGSFAPPLSSEESGQGYTDTSFTVAGMGFWAKGPDSEVAGGWVVDLPEDIIRHMTPGGMAIFGLQLPVDAREEPIAPPARVSLRPVAVPTGGSVDGRTVDAPMEVVSDLDAYARATLKDEQPRLLTKTIIRAVTKQILAAEAAVQTNKAVGGGAEGQVLETVVNLFGSAAATFSELADTRAWTTLPDHVEAALLDLPAGGYSLEVDGGYGTTTLGTIEIRPGQVLVVPARTFPQPVSNPH